MAKTVLILTPLLAFAIGCGSGSKLVPVSGVVTLNGKPLGEGRTLVHLAKKYLGNGNRYQELLELNGWTLQQAKRLGATQLVKIPIDPANGTEPK